MTDKSPMLKITCVACDGDGEWDEGPINTHSGWCDPVDPEYRQVKCPDCEGYGWTVAEDEGDD